jgi:hypothetical protein
MPFTGSRFRLELHGICFYRILSGVKSSGGAASLLAVAGRIACKDASRFEAFSCPWTLFSTFYKLL